MGRGRREHRRVRQPGQEQPLQAVEQDERGQLPARAGARGGDTEGSGGQGVGCAQCGGPHRPDRAAMLLEEKLEPIFHPDSYGYRPGRSAHDALAVIRRRCWKQGWILDLDVRAFFDSVPHDLLLKAVAHHTQERWALLYIARWLKAPDADAGRDPGRSGEGDATGIPDFPLLANVFMHYALKAPG